MTVDGLARLANVSTNTVVRLERGDGVHSRTSAAIATVLEEAGIEFIDENGGGPGVRLRQ